MPYPNDNKLNVIIAQTSGSADGTEKFPFVEKIISGSNLFIVTNASGELTGSTSFPFATFENLLVTGALTASIISASNSLTSSAATFTGPVSMSSRLSASGIYDAGILTVIGTTNLSNISASGNMSFSANPATLSGTNLVISASTGDFSGNLNATTLTVNTSIVDGGSLTVLGNTSLGDSTNDTTKITGSVSINGSLNVFGTTTVANLTASNISASGQIIAAGFTGSLFGTSSFATTALSSSISSINDNSTYYVTFVDGISGSRALKTDGDILSYTPNTNVLTIGVGSGSVVVGNNITMQDGGGSSQLRVGITTTDTASLLVSGNAFQVVKGTGATDRVSTNLKLSASNDVLFSSTTQATDFSNGAFHVDGGVSISKNLYISGSTFLAGDLTIYGSSSIVNISSSTLIIGDNRILLNAGSPIVRYAGIDVYDSGSGGIHNNVTSSFLWDSQSDSWLIFSANSSSASPLTASSAIIIGGPTGSFGNETSLTTNAIPKVQSSGKNITDSLLSDDGTTLLYTGTRISASQFTSSNGLFTNVFSTNVSSSRITASNALLTNVYSSYISSSVISSSNLRVELTGSITYATGVLVTYITGSFNTLTLSTGSFPGNAPGLVPTTPTSSGMPGQINVDNNFIYVYTNQVWKRVPLSQWSN